MPRIPRGVPSITYCRVQSSVGTIGQGDVIADGNSVTVIEPGQTSTRHEVAQVLERGISDEQVCELTMGTAAGSGIGTSLNPVAAFVNDAVTSVIFIIGSKQTKKWSFVKKTVLPFLANEMFHHVTEKDQQLAAHFYKAQINVSAFEIQDEVITDLIRPANRGLSLSVTVEDGTIVAGIHKETITDEMELRRLLADACDNRATHTLPIGGSIDTSSAVYEFTLYQSEGSYSAQSDNIKECTSRLILVDVPSVDPLVTGGAVDIRALEGVNLHKSLLTFHEVLKKLSTPSKASVAPFRASKLTHYLNELLGGNAIVVGLGILANGEPAISRKTLEVLGALNTSVHYPIGGKELTDTLRGLLSKYRASVLAIQDEVASKDASTSLIVQNEHHIERQLLDLQKDLAAAIIDKNEAVSDRERVFEMTELLRAKYATLMTDKLAQSEELAASEEDKISIAKALIEQRVEYNKLEQLSEAEKYELNVQLTTAKNTIAQLEGNILSLECDIDELKKQVEVAVEDKKVLRSEIVTLNEDIDNKALQIQAEKDKNLELGSELLTLVNRRDLLQAEVDNFNTKYNAVSDALSEKTLLADEVEGKLVKALQDSREKDETIFELKKQCSEVDLENKRMQLLADQAELAEREKKLLQGRKGSVGSINGDAVLGAVNRDKYDESLATNKKLSKIVKELEKNLKRTQCDLDEALREKEAINKECGEVRDKYRLKLSSMLTHTHMENGGITGGPVHVSDVETYKHFPHQSSAGKLSRKQSTVDGNGSKKGSIRDGLLNTAIAEHEEEGEEEKKSVTSPESKGSITAGVDNVSGSVVSPRSGSISSARRESSANHHRKSSAAVVPGAPAGTGPEHAPIVTHHLTVPASALLQQQLLDSYNHKEAAVNAEMDLATTQKHNMRTAYRTLYDKYKEAMEMLEDYIPKASTLKVKVLEEQLLFNEAVLLDADNTMDEWEVQERKALSERLQHAEQASLSENERMSFILATYQRNLEVSEEKLAASQQECVDLHIQIQQLLHARDGSPLRGVSIGTANDKSPTHSASAAVDDNEKTLQASKAAAAAAVEAQQALMQQRDAKQLQMYETLTSEIQGLKQQLMQNNNSNSNGSNAIQAPVSSGSAGPEVDITERVPTTPPPAVVEDDKAPLATAALLKSDSGAVGLKPTPPVTPGRSRKGSAVGAATSHTQQTNDNNATAKNEQPSASVLHQLEEYRTYIKQLETNASNAMSSHLRIAESRALDSATKAAAVEEELKAYQQYMRNVVPQYKKQIAFMKQQLAVALAANKNAVLDKNSTSSSNNDGTHRNDDFKLPQIK